MFTFTLLSTFLILSHICTVGDGDWNSLRLSATIITAKNIHGHVLHNVELFYEDCAQPRRRLLGHSRWIKQAYRSNDYDVVPRRYRSQNKFDDNRSYHSSIKNDEDEDEEEEEEEGDEENKINDETVNDETDEQEEDEEETVAAPARSGSRNRALRSGYVHGSKIGERNRQKVVRIRSTTEVCEDESTESPQYYEYETEVRNIASQDGNKCRVAFFAKIFGASFLILFL